METLTAIYIGAMILLGAATTNRLFCKNSDKIIYKKRFKHYRFH